MKKILRLGFILAFSLLAFSMNAQVTLLTESFAGPALPAGWETQNIGAGVTERWSISPGTAYAGGTVSELMCSFQGGGSILGTSRIIAPALNTVGVTSLALNFKHMYDDYGPGLTFSIQSSIDKVTWTNENWWFESGYGAIPSSTVNTTILNNLNSATTYIAFVVTGDLYQFNYWYIDDVNIINNSLAYCIPPASISPGFTWITNVTTSGGVSDFNNSSFVDVSAYSDYSSSVIASNTQLATTTISFTSYLYALSYSAWIDFNNNGVFEASERIIANANVAGAYTVTDNFTVPFSAAPGTYRMRVRGNHFGYGIPTDPCIQMEFGETEDYSFTVIAAGPPSITVIQPSAGAYWQWGTLHNVEWTSSNIAQMVKIDYSTDGGASWITDVPSITTINGNNSYSWTAPFVTGVQNSSMLRVITLDGTTAGNSNIFTLSNIPQLKFDQPLTGAQWTAGQTYSVDILNQGSYVNLGAVLYLTTDGGLSWNAVMNVWELNNGSNSYNFLVDPITPSSATCKFALSPNTGIDPNWQYYTESGIFEIIALPKSITVNQPATDAYWQSGTLQTVEWTSSNVTQMVNIDYSTDGGASWMNSVTSISTVDGNNSYTLSVPWVSGVKNNSKLRVITTDGSVSGISNLFTISDTPRLKIIQPIIGAQLTPGQTYSVEIVNQGSYAIFDAVLYLTTDGGIAYSAAMPVWELWNGSNTFNFLVDLITPASANCRLALSSNLGYDPNWQYYAETEIFEILALTKSITVTQPVAGAYWQSGTQHNIEWTSVNITQTVNIQYSMDNGTNWYSISTGYSPVEGNNMFTWTVPIVSGLQNNTKIRVITNDGTVFGFSNAFTLSDTPQLLFTQPTTGTQWTEGQTNFIEIINQGPEYPSVLGFDIWISTNGGANYYTLFSINSNIQNGLNQYAWAIPALATNQAILQFYDLFSGESFQSEVFEILPVPVSAITINQPTTGATWQSGTQQNIEWTNTNVSQLEFINYSTDGGSSWTMLAANIPPVEGNNSYTWTVPWVSGLQNNSLVRVITDDGTVSGTSNTFTLSGTPQLVFTQPTTGTPWTAGQTYSIEINNQGPDMNSGAMDVYLSENGGGSASYIFSINSIPNGISQYGWTIGSSISTNLAILMIWDTNTATWISQSSIFEIVPPPTAPIADFSSDFTGGDAPLTIQFTDLSANNPTSWTWDFGDASASSEKNPLHVYATAGTYTVSLSVGNAAGNDTKTIPNYITVTTPVGAPTLSNVVITSFDQTTAIAQSTVTSDGGDPVTAYGVCWNTFSNPTITNFATNDGTGIGPFTSSLTGLTAGTTYYVRAYATNSVGTAYGNEVSFTTLTPSELVINVDMNGSGLIVGQQVFISGAFGGIYGTWDQPGINPNNEMFDPNSDGIYTIAMYLPDGPISFKFFIGPDWNTGDNAVPDRTYTVSGSANLTYTWGVGVPVSGITITGAGNATTIETDNGTLQMSASVLPVDATNQTVDWTVTNGKASISADGLLTALENGAVTVTATSKDGTNISGSMDITLSNQVVSPTEASTMVFSLIGDAFYLSDGVTRAAWDYDIDLTYIGTAGNESSYRINSQLLFSNSIFKVRKDHQWAESYGFDAVSIFGDPTNFICGVNNFDIQTIAGKTYEITFMVDWVNNTHTLSFIPIPTAPSAIIKIAPTPPVADGVIDASDPWIAGDWHDVAIPDVHNTYGNMSAKFQLMYDATNLYFAAIVTDGDRFTGYSTTYMNDRIEFYIAMDTTSGTNGIYKQGDKQLSLQAVADPNATGGLIECPQGAPVSGVYKCVDNGTDYVQEWTMPWAELSEGMAPGWDQEQFKFDIQVANATADGQRTQQMFWNNNSDLQWNNTTKFGLVKLETPIPYINALPCAGTPDPGNTLSTAGSVCLGVNFTLSLQNNVVETGLTYQWQSSADNSSWTDIPGATGNKLTISQTVSTYYRCSVTCSTGPNTGYSNSTYILMNGLTSCYCTPPASQYPCGAMWITNVTTSGGINDFNSSTDCSGSSYSDYSSSAIASNWQLGNTTMTFTSYSYPLSFSVWIDFNDNGIFEATERVIANDNTGGLYTFSDNISVPMSAAPGTHRMRVRGEYYGYSGAPSDPCNQLFYGETEDYAFTVIATNFVTGITVTSAGSATTIETDGGTLQMSTDILPVDATNPAVKWTVTDGTGKASISVDGLLTAQIDGTVTVSATTKDGTNISSSMVITISNQIVSMADRNIIKDGEFATDGPIYVWPGNGNPWITWSGNGGTAEVIGGVCTMSPAAASDAWQLQVNQTDWMVYNGTSYVLTFTAWSVAGRTFVIDLEDPNNNYNRLGSSTDPEAINGRSEWVVDLTTTPKTFTFYTTVDAAQANTKYLINIMTSGATDVVYIDNIYLISQGFAPASLTLNQPLKGEFWQSGTQKTINWNSVNVSQNVNIDYSIDGGNTWNSIITGVTPVNGNNAYTWTVPNVTGVQNNSMLRVITADGTLVGTSSVISISDIPQLAFVQPAAGSQWIAGQTYSIEINNQGNLLNEWIAVYYSIDGGSTWNSAVQDINQMPSGVNTYSWTVDQYIQSTANCKLAVSQNVSWGYNPGWSYYSESGLFEIQSAPSSIVVDQPSTGLFWKSGSLHYIEWTSVNVGQNVNLDYSLDGGASWTNFASNISSSNGYNNFGWTVANVTGLQNNSQVRVISNDGTVSGISNVFTISDTPQFAVIQPATGTPWTAGRRYTIDIVNQGPYTNLSAYLFLSTDGGINWNYFMYLQDLNPGLTTFNGLLDPTMVASANCKLAITSWGYDPNYPYFTESDLFEIQPAPPPPTAIIKKATTTPVVDGTIDEVWATADAHNIDLPFGTEAPTLGAPGTTTWKALWADDGIYLLLQVNDDVFSPAFNGTSPSQNWMYDKPEIWFDVNAELADGLGAQNDANGNGSGHYQFSPEFINGELSGGVASTVGSNGATYSYNVTDPTYVAEYFMPFTKFKDKYGVEVPKNATLGFDITIIDNDVIDPIRNRAVWANNGAINESWFNMDGIGTVTLEGAPASIPVIKPATGEFWQSGTQHNIEWRSENSSQNVNLEYSTDGGSSWTSIITDITPVKGNNTYSWTVPFVTGLQSNSQVRVITTDGTISGSSTIFTLSETPQLTLTQPSAGAVWTAGQTYNIELTNLGSALYVDAYIYLSTDGGVTWNPFMYVWPSFTGVKTFNWTIDPVTASSANCKLAISNYWGFDPNWQYYSESGIFEIQAAPASITINQPTTGRFWQSGTQNTIEWTSVNISQNENLEYSTDGGITWSTIAAGILPVNGYNSYAWTVPNVTGVQYNSNIRVITADGTLSAISNAFTISDTPMFTFTQPSSGTIWNAGQAYQISVNNQGPYIYLNADIYLSINGGTTWKYLTYLEQLNAGSNIIDAQVNPITPASANCKLAISKWGYDPNYQYYTESGIFEIQAAPASLTLSQPSAGAFWQSGTQQTIEWMSVNVNQVENLEYSMNGGTDWTSISTNIIPVNGYNTYSWTVPNVTGLQNNSLVRVVSTDGTMNGTSNIFTISEVPQFEFTQPTTGTKWTAGQTYEVILNNQGPDTYVDAYIGLSVNGLNTWDYSRHVGQINSGSKSFSWPIDPLTAASASCKFVLWGYIPSWQFMTSSGPFEILTAPASITVSQPASNEFWQSGTQRNIEWTSVNPNQDEKIQYSLDAGISWLDIGTVTSPSNGVNTYTWTVANVTGIENNAMIRVLSMDETVTGSSSVFTLSDKPQLTFTQPSTGTVWTAGQTYDILFNNLGAEIYRDAYIYLSTNAGITWSPLKYVWNFLNGSTTISWQINPTTGASANCKLAYSSYSGYDPNWQYNSESGTFEILAAPTSIALNQPNAGAFWQSGTQQTIDWMSVNVNQNENLEYSTDGGINWTSIATGIIPVNGNNTYSWTVPNVTGIMNNSMLRVITADGTLSNTSNIFSISEIPQYAFASPVPGDKWTAGQSYNIMINNLGSYTWLDANIYLSTNGGITWNAMFNLGGLNAGSNIKNWQIDPTTSASANCKLAISSYSGYNPGWQNYTESGTFEIQAAPLSIGVVEPTANAYWQSGSVQSIVWNSVNVNQSEKIQYSIDGGTTWVDITTIASPVNGQNTFTWTVEPVTGIEIDAMIRIQSNDGTVFGTSSLFTISDQAQFVFTQPTTGKKWQAGQEYIVMLQNNGAEVYKNWGFDLQLSSDGGNSWNSVKSLGYTLASGQNVYTWAISPITLPSANYKLSVVGYSWSGTARFAVSQAFEILLAQPSLSINQPASESFLLSGSQADISWVGANVANVNIDFSLDNGGSWTNIVSGHASSNGNNNYSWTVPVVTGIENDVRIRITDIVSGIATESQVFTISSLPVQIVVLKPNGGEEWVAGNTYSIQFNNQGPNRNQIILNFTADGSTWDAIDWLYYVPTGIYTYNWQIPSNITPSNNYLISVETVDSWGNPLFEDKSDNYFSVVAPASNLSITSPLSGNFWQSNSNQGITWNCTGISSVNIDYSLDGGSTWATVASNIASVDGNNSYIWLVPTVLTTEIDARIRISQASNSLIQSVSNLFTIATANPYLTVISPNGGENLQAGTSYQVKFENGGQYINYVNFYLSTDNGLNWSFVDNIWNVSTGVNTYNWNISTSITSSGNCLVKLTDSNNGAITDNSDNVFAILSAAPTLTVTNPQGISWWISGTAENIYWVSANVSSVNVYYSIDGGTNWSVIASNMPSIEGSNFLNWNVASVSAIAFDAKIKVEDASNASLFAQSSLFTISNEPIEITVVNPNGGNVWTAGQTYSVKYNNSGPATWADIYLSSDNGSSWNYLGYDNSATHGLNYFSWTIPNDFAPSVNCLVKVNSGLGADLSDNVFEIINLQPSLSINEPTNGYYWMSGTQHNIYWQATNITSVDISYSLDGGLNWLSLSSNVPTVNGQNVYNWTVPNVTQNNNNCKIKIESALASLVVYSNAFTISNENQFIILSPTTADVWNSGQSHYIIFKNNLGNTSIELYYSVNGGINWIYINWVSATPGNNVYSWNIPAGVSSQNCVIGIPINSDWFISNTFEIKTLFPAITLVNPSSGDRGQVLTISISGEYTHFLQSTPTVWLNQGATELYPNSVNVANDGLLTAEFTFGATDPIGLYNVNVKESVDGTITKTDGFLMNSVSPVAGTAASNTTICIGSSASLTLSGYFGSIQWQESADGSTGWQNVLAGTGANSANYTTGNLTATSYYRAEVTEPTFAAVYSNVVTVTVNSLPVVSFAPVAGTCAGAAAINLTQGLPFGGTYSGTGIAASSLFNPATAGLGIHIITYTFTDGNGCTNNASQSITVNDLPAVTFAAVPAVSVDAAAFSITQGSPAGGGGTYSGTGITASPLFNPSVAGIGTFTLTYTYTDGNGCTNSATQTITVNALPPVTFAAVPDVCIDAAAFNLTQGSPAGGTYSGTGITASPLFDPAVAGAGTHTITYSYTDGTGTTTATRAIVVNPLPASAGIISGNATICLVPVSGTYTVPVIDNATSYVWTVPTTGANGSSSTNSINVNFTSSFVSGNITVTGSNSCGTGSVSIIGVSANSSIATAGTISGPTTVCPGQTSVNYSVPAITNATSYVWTLPTGASGTSTSNSINVDFALTYLSDGIEVSGQNNCTTGTPSIIAVSVNPFPAGAGIITGETAVCQGQTTVSYTVPAIDNATSYVWTSPTGSTVTGTTNSITVDYSASTVSGNVTVKGTNSCGDGNVSSLAVVIGSLPANAGSISGLLTVCQGQNLVAYSATTIANASSYVWTLPSGATGTSSTKNISVNYSTSAVSGEIVWKGRNSCGDGVAGTLPITVNPIPISAGAISGDAIICEGQNAVTYTVPAVTNATSYFWTLPTGVTGTSTTNTINVNFAISFVSGSIEVYGENDCGIGSKSTLAVTVRPKPAAAGAISGSAAVCQGQTGVTYTVPEIANATAYVWTLPAGATGASETNSIVVDFGASFSADAIEVYGKNACYNGTANSIVISVSQIPASAGAISGLTTVCLNQNLVVYNVPTIANASSYIWTLPNGATGTSTSKIITVNFGPTAVSGAISVKGFSSCEGAPSSTDITVKYPYQDEQLCIITIDTATGKNMIVWEKTDFVDIASYNVYREAKDGLSYNFLKNIPVDSLSVYVDMTSEPESKSQKYYITAIDNCNNESAPSKWHRPMLLTSSVGTGQNTVNLAWTEYITQSGEVGSLLFTSYIIYRSTSANSQVPIDTIPSDNTLYPDNDAPVGVYLYYRIAGIKADPCDPAGLLGKKASSGPFVHSLSNLNENRIEGTGIINPLADGLQLAVYPSPFTDQTTINYNLEKPTRMKVEVYNVIGEKLKVLLDENQSAGYHKVEMKAADVNYKPGVYYLRITVDEGVVIRKTMLTR
jgi:hypothetical protein